MAETRTDHLHNHETNVRFSLLNNGVLENDLQTREGSREVIYTTGNHRQEELRRVLDENGVVLGHPVESTTGHVVYQVPLSARPLSLEATVPSVASGPYAFTDRELMFDLGELSSHIHRISGGIIAGPDAEKAFALNDFVPEGDSQLYATPGIERLLTAVPEGADLLTAQMSAFSTAFGARYEEYIGAFIEGYNQ